MIRSGMSKYERGMELRRIAQQQLTALNNVNIEKSYQKMMGTYKEPKKMENKAPTPSVLRLAQDIVNPELSAINKALKQALNHDQKEEKSK